MLGETKFGQHNYGKDYQDGFLETVEDDWLAPLSDGLEATQLGPDPSGDIRRVNSSPAMHFRPSGGDSANLTGAWEGSTAPLPIRPMRCMNPDDFSSLESSQSLLNCGHGSYTDDSALMHRQHTGSSVMHRKGSFGAGVRYPHSMPLQSNYSMEGPPFVPQDALSAVEYTMSGNIPCSYPMPPPNPPGQSGHWAWIPADHEAPGACPVPVASGPVRLPVPVNSSFDFDLDLQLLDGVDILEMADTLAPEVAPTRPRNLPRAVGSCPLPALLEDSLSAEDDYSDNTIQRMLTGSPSLDGLERFPSGTMTSDVQRSGTGTATGTGRSSHSHSQGGAGGGGIAIPGPRSAPFKVQRPSRSLSSPHLAHAILGSSCPVGGGGSIDRPVRSAARRSLAVTAAALREAEDEYDSENDSEEAVPMSYSAGISPVRRSTGATGSSGNLKKKHNPWSLEETMALVEGVRLAGLGKWAEIKRLAVPGVANVLDGRSAVDLKDKWRNLTRVARLPKTALKTRLQRGPSDIPLETMLLGKAKQHFFMDAQMHEVVEPVLDSEIKCGSGTKVVFTIGPACQDVQTLSKMLLSGVSCARLDLTWGSLDFHRTSLQNLSAAMRATKRLCAVWIDTVGREIIVRMPAAGDQNGWMVIEKTPIEFSAGSEVVISTNLNAQASPSLLPVSTPSFPMLVQPGQILHVGRFLATGAEGGSLFLKVVSTTTTEICCVAQNDASLTGLLTVIVSHREYSLNTHAHDLNRDLPLMTQHDVSCIQAFGKEFEIDFVSLSYCNSAEDVVAARSTLDSMGLLSTKIIAKVERKAAVHNFDGIIAAADGVLLSRGNLGLDFEPEEMALLQKRCVLRCNSLGKPIIITRFVDTMVNTPRPTRAEATDVANAVLDGADGVMLAAETLRGLYPVETVETVVKLCKAAENYFDYRQHHEEMMGEAYEEEVSLQRVYSSADYLSMHNRAPSPAPLHPMPVTKRTNSGLTANGHAIDSAAGAAEGLVGSPGTGHMMDMATSGDSPVSGEMTRPSSFGVLRALRTENTSFKEHISKVTDSGAPYLTKVESIASSAVRTAEKINAGLIIVLAQTGRTVSLVAKYRPPMPVLAVVVPTLKSDHLGWQLEGKFLARQCLVMRGVHPMLAAPMTHSGEGLLGEAISAAHAQDMVRPLEFVVCILSQQGSLVVKVAQVNQDGTGIRALRPGECLDHPAGLEGLPKDPFESSGNGDFGTPPSPKSLHMASLSLGDASRAGENTMYRMVPTDSEFTEASVHFSNSK